MAGWRIRDDSYGNPIASYKETIDGVLITSYLADCDGDMVNYAVYENGNVLVTGTIRPEDGPTHGKTASDEEWAWNEAKRLAEDAIIHIPGLPRIAWPEKIMAAFVEMAKINLLERCDDVIAEFENRNPNHPLVQHFKK